MSESDSNAKIQSELLTEADFLLRRMSAQHHHTRPRCYGISADALALYALGEALRPKTPGTPVSRLCWKGEECGSNYPHDKDDLAACELTYLMAPKHLKERMLPVLEEFRAWVYERRNRHGNIMQQTTKPG